MQRIPNSLVQHAYREANKSVDALARLGHALSSDFVVFPSPPAEALGGDAFLFFSFFLLSLLPKNYFFFLK